MGGGAGISLKSKEFREDLEISKDNNGVLEFRFVDDGKLESFDMEGYQDGFSGLKGDLLTFSFIHNFNNENIDNIINNAKVILIEKYSLDDTDIIDFISIDVKYNIQLDDMIWGGYTRGNIENVSSFDASVLLDYAPICVNFEVNKNGGFSIEIDIEDYKLFEDVSGIYKKTNEDEFNDCYNMIFLQDFEDEDDSYMHFDDIKMLYGK